jgi:hypothetical protein
MTNNGESHLKTIMKQNAILPTDKVHMALAIKQGTVMGINDAFMVATYLTIAAFILSFFIRNSKPKGEETVPVRKKEIKKVPQLQ